MHTRVRRFRVDLLRRRSRPIDKEIVKLVAGDSVAINGKFSIARNNANRLIIPCFSLPSDSSQI